MQLSERSHQRLQGVHPDLQRIVLLAATLTDTDFIVTEGLRTVERQRQLVAKGASQTMTSRHITGHAVDLAATVDGEVRWDWPLYHRLATAMKEAARQLGIRMVWGGDWRSFKDGPHFELDRHVYP